MITGRTRVVLVKLHLYIGLSFGALFVLLGLTGTVLSWRDEIDAALNPELLVASAPAPLSATADAVDAVMRKLQADPRYGKPRLLMLPVGAREVFVAWYPVKASPGQGAGQGAGQGPGQGAGQGMGQGAGQAKPAPVPGRSRQVMVDPVTLDIKGERIWGEPGLSRPQLMPTVFHLHHYLLAGDTGKTIAGIGGMMLLIAVLGGIALWWPKLRPRAVVQAFRISHGGSWWRFVYSLHRAGGIFAAPVLATMAFSGWYLDLPKWVTPLVGSVMTVTPASRPTSMPPNEAARRIEAHQAVRAAQALYPAARVSRISFPRQPGDVYEVRLRQPGEVRQDGGATRVYLDAYTGARLGARDPLIAPAGDTLLNWMYPLHTGEAFGLPGRIFITAFGLAPLMFAVTGVMIWWKRRRGHRRHLEREALRAAAH